MEQLRRKKLSNQGSSGVGEESSLETLILQRTFNEYTVSQNLLMSQDLILTSRNIKKVALTAYDTKRWLLADGTNTQVYAHYLNVIW